MVTFPTFLTMIVGDHPRIPLLFGVMRKQQPVSIVLKFHGNGVKSLTLIKAAKEKKIVKWTGRKFLMWLLKSKMLYNICTNVAAKRFSINYLSSHLCILYLRGCICPTARVGLKKLEFLLISDEFHYSLSGFFVTMIIQRINLRKRKFPVSVKPCYSWQNH